MNIYTPKGELIKLKEGSTILDFAFIIHSEIAYKATGAFIHDLDEETEGKEVSLNYKLQEEDVVCIKTSEDSFPEKSWYGMVTMSKSRYGLNKFDWEEIDYLNWKARKEAERENNIALTEERIADLKNNLGTMHTKQLLALLAKYRVCMINSFSYWSWGDDESESVGNFRDRCVAFIKEELSTREHVMNKIESKKARQKTAKVRNTRNCRSRSFRR